jgi:hypothetical protein
MVQPPCFLASAEPADTFAGNVQNLALFDPSAAVWPAERDVHFEVIGPKGFATFGFPPDYDDANARYQLVDGIGGGGVELNIAEPREPEPKVARAVTVTSRAMTIPSGYALPHGRGPGAVVDFRLDALEKFRILARRIGHDTDSVLLGCQPA